MEGADVLDRVVRTRFYVLNPQEPSDRPLESPSVTLRVCVEELGRSRMEVDRSIKEEGEVVVSLFGVEGSPAARIFVWRKVGPPNQATGLHSLNEKNSIASVSLLFLPGG